MILPLYIDPGTGSMLFSLCIGLATTLIFASRVIVLKLRFILSGGKADKNNSSKIPYLIFSDHKRYWNVFKPVCDEFEKRKIDLVYYTQSKDDPVFLMEYSHVKPVFIGEGNRGFVKMNMLNAGTVLSTTPGLDVYQWKRSKSVDRYVHVPHSCDIEGYRMFGLDFYDAVLCTGQHQVSFLERIESLRPNTKSKDKVIAGATFFDGQLEKVSSLPKHVSDMQKPVVLLASSWGPSSVLSKYGDKLIGSLINTGYEIIVRPHPQSFTAETEMIGSLMNKYPQVEWNRDNDNLAVLNRADMLITDFSGIMFDWSFLFDRPFMFTKTDFDASVYDAAWIDEKPWMIKAAEELGIVLDESKFDSLADVIKSAIGDKSLQEARNLARGTYWQNHSHAAEKIVDYMTDGSNA